MFPIRLKWPNLNYIRVHYAYVLTLAMVGLITLSPAGNMAAIDSLFQGISAGTVTGLNTFDMKDMHTYQQIVIYLIPMLGNQCFVNVIVVLVRLYWFETRFKEIVRLSRLPTSDRSRRNSNLEATPDLTKDSSGSRIRILRSDPVGNSVVPDGLRMRILDDYTPDTRTEEGSSQQSPTEATSPLDNNPSAPGHITFSSDTYQKVHRGRALRIPGPREFEAGQGVQEIDYSDDEMSKVISRDQSAPGPSGTKTLPALGRLLSRAASVEQAASSAFVIGGITRTNTSRSRSRRPLSRASSTYQLAPYLSYQPTIGRNSKFLNLTEEQREELGGIEYRSLKLLAKIAASYYLFFHVLGAVCLVAWIFNTDQKYKDVLSESALNKTWWSFFSSMTAFNNLGFTLTPDSMVGFRESTFPMLFMTFLIYIGNTAYPCMLRFVIWSLFKVSPKESAIREPLGFLLDHPRRCYTLLFPSRETWLLVGTLIVLNGVDVILFLVLDLNNPEVTVIDTTWHRFCAALFQAASSRTTGTSTFTLAKIHPAVQFSLMVMMYISVFPIAISVRRTNTYEESSLGVYDTSEDMEDMSQPSYLGAHIKMQLAFDLWYVFLGVFILTIAEGGRLADGNDPAFNLYAIFFEVVSAYGNVGLSLGHPTMNTSMTGKFGVVGKLVICAMMVRGRHRGLPYELDRAIILPNDKNIKSEDAGLDATSGNLTRRHTQ